MTLKRLILTLLIVSFNPFVSIDTHASVSIYRSKKRKSDKVKDHQPTLSEHNVGFLARDASWLERQYSKKYRNARLAFRNNWPQVVEKTINKMHDSGIGDLDNDPDSDYLHFFLRDVLPDAKKKLKATDAGQLFSELEKHNIDCTADGFEERAAELFAAQLCNQYRGKYDSWLVDFKKEVVFEKAERQRLNNNKMELAYNRFCGFAPETTLPKWGGVWVQRRQVSDHAIKKMIIAKRQYSKISKAKRACVIIGNVVDITINIGKVGLGVAGIPVHLGNVCQDAVLECESVDDYISGIIKSTTILGAGALIYSLAQSGMVVPALQAAASLGTSAIGQLMAIMILPLAVGAAAYYGATAYGVGGGGAILIAIIFGLITLAVEAYYIKKNDPKKYKKLKRRAKKLADPIKLLSCIILAPAATYCTYYTCMYRVGLPIWQSLASSGITCLTTLLISHSIAMGVKDRQEKREDGMIGVWGHFKKDTKKIYNKTKKKWINNPKKETKSTWSKEKKIGALIGGAILIALIGRKARDYKRALDINDALPDVPENDIFATEDDFSDDETKKIFRRHSQIMDRSFDLQMSSSDESDDGDEVDSFDEEESDDDDAVDTMDRAEQLSKKLSNEELEKSALKLSRKISGIEKEQNPYQNPV